MTATLACPTIPARAVYLMRDGIEQITLDGCTDDVAVGYVCDGRGAYPAAYMCFRGKAGKPAQHYAARSREAAAVAVRKFLADAVEIQKRIDARKAEAAAARAALNAATDLPAGTILVQSWGWEQTNINFFRVVGHKGRTGALVVPIAARSCGLTGNGMADHCIPDLDAPTTAAPVLMRQTGKDSVRVPRTEGYAWGRDASRWDGEPEYRSWYA